MVWLVLGANSRLILCAQSAPDKAAEGCKPCQLSARLVPRDEIQGLSRTELESALRNAKACVQAAQAHAEKAAKDKPEAGNDKTDTAKEKPETTKDKTETANNKPEDAKDKQEDVKDKPYCNVQPGDVRRLISEIETVMNQINLAQEKQGTLSAVLSALSGRQVVPRSPSELPPRDVCSQCDGLWEAMMAVMGFSKLGKSLVTNINTGRDAANVENLYQALEKLCLPRRRILNSPDTIEELTYYTRTQTWAAYLELKRALETPTLKAFCRQ